jgi:ribosome-associated toxin RatA of RatAB toxin-antitoxin module
VTDQTTEKIVVSAPPAAVYEVAADIERYPDWVSDIKAVNVDERDGLGRPHRVTFRTAAFGRSTKYTLEYDYSSAPQVIAWRQVEGDLTTMLDGSYSFGATNGGTEVTYHLEAGLRVPIPTFIKTRAQGRIQATALRELKTRAENLQGA